MKNKTWHTRTGMIAFWLTVAVFLSLFLYLTSTDDVSIHSNVQLLKPADEFTDGIDEQTSAAIDQIRREYPLMVFSALGFLLGLVLVAVSLYFHYAMKISSNSMLFLGLFSLLLGLWKITELTSLPILLRIDTMVISYIRIDALFLACTCMMLYFCTLFTGKGRRMILIMIILSSLASIALILEQIMGIDTLQQNPIDSHGILLIAFIAIPMNCAFNRMVYGQSCLIHTKRLILLLILLVGTVLDMIFYRSDSALPCCSIAGLIVYMLVVFTRSVQSSTWRAYTDASTGLMSRTRWNDLMQSESFIPQPYCFLMIDLNGLKQINDTLGHEAGDRAILQLSCILRNTLPRNSIICRWGGDEFAVAIPHVDREAMERHIAELVTASNQCTSDHPELPISFSLGAALSSDHPGASRAELFRLADEDMYRNKKMWYKTSQ